MKFSRHFLTLLSCVCAAAALRAGHILIDDFDALVQALGSAVPGDTLLIEDGVYDISGTWALQVTADRVTIRGLRGSREAVIIRGRGMDADGHHGFWVSGNDVTIQDLTVENVRNHCIQSDIHTDGLTVRNCVLRDAGEQILKVPCAEGDTDMCEGGLVEDCLFEYSAGIGPRDYIGGIDCHFGRNWIVRRNIFKNIASPENAPAEHAVHFWSWSENTLVENNLIINCDRGIGFGLAGSGHVNGMIRNNIIYHDVSSGGGFADVSVEVYFSDDAWIYNNTVFQAHAGYFAGIKNWGGKRVSMVNNCVHMSDGFYGNLDQALWVTAGGTGTVSHNEISTPDPSLFAAVDIPDAVRVDDVTDFLHIRDVSVSVLIDRGTSLLPDHPESFIDFDGDIRPQGAGVDIGADEYVMDTPVLSAGTVHVRDFRLYPNFPNPFNPATVIGYFLPVPSRIRAVVYDLNGHRIRILAHGRRHAGHGTFVWDGTDGEGMPAPSGLYVVVLDAGSFIASEKILLIR